MRVAGDEYHYAAHDWLHECVLRTAAILTNKCVLVEGRHAGSVELIVDNKCLSRPCMLVHQQSFVDQVE